VVGNRCFTVPHAYGFSYAFLKYVMKFYYTKSSLPHGEGDAAIQSGGGVVGWLA
jgi:hypothetical protein